VSTRAWNPTKDLGGQYVSNDGNEVLQRSQASQDGSDVSSVHPCRDGPPPGVGSLRSSPVTTRRSSARKEKQNMGDGQNPEVPTPRYGPGPVPRNGHGSSFRVDIGSILPASLAVLDAAGHLWPRPGLAPCGGHWLQDKGWRPTNQAAKPHRGRPSSNV
jgi:hypothetical protein